MIAHVNHSGVDLREVFNCIQKLVMIHQRDMNATLYWYKKSMTME